MEKDNKGEAFVEVFNSLNLEEVRLAAADQTDSVYTVGKSRKSRSASRQFWLITGLMALLLILIALMNYL